MAIEIDITHSSVNKFGIYSALGVPELWRYNGRTLQFYQVVEGQYIESEISLAFPLLSANDLSRFIEQSKTMGEIALLQSFRAWLRNQTAQRANNS